MSRRIRWFLILLVTAAAMGLMPGLQGGQPASNPPRAVFHVNALTGSDASNCGTRAGSACRTIQAAIDQTLMTPRADVRIVIAPGDYDGGLLVAGREPFGSATITLAGNRGQTRLVARGEEQVGITIRRSGNIILENLEIDGFEETGIKVILSSGIEVRSSTLTGNLDGIVLAQSETWLRDVEIRSSLRHGISCEGGSLTLGHDPGGSGLLLADNASSGLRADMCHARFEAPARISGSHVGLLAINAGVINLGLRGDVGVVTEQGQIALNADCHGMIEGYANSCVGDCSCVVTHCGLCISGMTSNTGGHGTGTRTYRGQ